MSKQDKKTAIDIITESKCTGCFGCYNVCPFDAIRMKLNDEGFYMPVIDREKCTSCGVCNLVCPVIQEDKQEEFETNYYVFKSNDSSLLEVSSSGGFWGEIANFFLKKDYLIYGVTLNDDFKVEHICIKNEEELYKIQGSKYVQSDVGFEYKEIKQKLLAGKKICFSGTPCQVTTLNLIIKNLPDKFKKSLFTFEVVCHGVNSNSIWEKYLEYLENQSNSKIKNIAFRNKDKGWINYSFKVEFENGTKFSQTLNENLYLQIFLKNKALRKSCYDCPVDGIPRHADFTMGDLWGGGKEFFNDQGLSFVGINNLRAEKVYQEFIRETDAKSKDISSKIILNGNPRASKHSIKYPEDRNKLSSLKEEDFKTVYNTLITSSDKISYIRSNIKSRLKAVLRKYRWPQF